MRSTDMNLNNPMNIEKIGLQKLQDAWNNPTIELVTQDFYDLLQTKNPHTIYIINDTYPVKMYYGDLEIKNETNKLSYVMGPSDKYNEYVIYMWRIINGSTTLTEICRYNDPQLAIEALNRYNKVGGDDKLKNSIYDILNSYIDEEISIHDAIVSVISLQYKDDPRLQNILTMLIPHLINRTPFRDISSAAKELIMNRAEKDDNLLYKYYRDIYNVFVKYDFFEDKKYHDYVEMRDLHNEVSDIFNVQFTMIGITI